MKHQSLFSSNFTKTISPNQFQFVFFQASLPLVEPVAVVEAAIDDLIEDRVALERLEEVYMAKSLTSQDLNAALAPAIPPKPTAFHILQLERLLDGRICPGSSNSSQTNSLPHTSA